MGKSKQGGAFGFLRGKVGSVTFSVLPANASTSGKKEQIVRALPESVSNPKSAAQCMQRMKLAPAQKFYAAFSALLSNAFQGVNYGEESRRYFISKCMALDGPYIPKGVDRFIPAVYPFSEGSLPSVPIQGFAAGTSLITLDVKSSEATITPAILADALDVDTDTQISVVIVNNHSGLFVPEYAGFEERIRISDLPANALDKDDDGYIRIDPSELGLTADAMVACCVVLSKQDASGSWLRSTQDMVISDELYASLYSTDALTNAIASYQDASSNNSINSDWYYNLGMAQPFPGSLRTMYMENNSAVSKKMVVGIKVINGVTRYTVFANSGLTGMMEVKEDGTLGYTEGNDFNDTWAQSKGYAIGAWEDAMAAQLGNVTPSSLPPAPQIYYRIDPDEYEIRLVDADGKLLCTAATGGDSLQFTTATSKVGIQAMGGTDEGLAGTWGNTPITIDGEGQNFTFTLSGHTFTVTNGTCDTEITEYPQ